MLVRTSKEKNRPLMIHQNALLGFFNQEHFQTYQTPVAKVLKSVEAAILFQELVQRYQYHMVRDELIEIPSYGHGWFYHTREAIEDRTAISRRQMDNAIHILEKRKIIDVVKSGLPCKRYFRPNFEGIQELLNNISSLYTVCKQEGTECTNSTVHLEQTPSLYIEEPNKESNKEREGDEPPPAPAKFKKTERALHVNLSDIEHACLVKKHGHEKTLAAYEKLSTWKQNTPKSKWKKVDYLSIQNWVMDALDEEELKAKKKGPTKLTDKEEERIEAHKAWFKAMVEASKKPVGESYNAHDQGVTFYNSYNGYNQSECIYFKDVKFKDLITHELRQRQYVRS